MTFIYSMSSTVESLHGRRNKKKPTRTENTLLINKIHTFITCVKHHTHCVELTHRSFFFFNWKSSWHSDSLINAYEAAGESSLQLFETTNCYKWMPCGKYIALNFSTSDHFTVVNALINFSLRRNFTHSCSSSSASENIIRSFFRRAGNKRTKDGYSSLVDILFTLLCLQKELREIRCATVNNEQTDLLQYFCRSNYMGYV